MSNAIDWGKIYCSTWWGNASNVETINISSRPFCFINFVSNLFK